MGSEWKLEELGKIVTGKTPPSTIKTAYSASGMPFVTPRDMDGRKWIITTERCLSADGIDAVKKSVVPAGSISVSCIGSDMGKAARLPHQSVTNQQINTLIPDENNCDPDYLYYVLSAMQQELKDIAGGSATPILNKSHFGKVRVFLPAIKYQRQAACILAALDQKIQLNHQINQTLEQMAQAIFKSWFVDFEPVKAKIAALEAGGSEEDALLAAMQAISGKGEAELTRLQTEQPEQYAELRSTAELFPAAMQDSEFGEIPEGWTAGTLSNIAHFTNERISKDKLTLSNYVSTENMLENKAGIVDASSLPNSASVPSFEPSEVLVSNIRPYFKKIWFASKCGGRSPDVLGFKTIFPNTSDFLFNLLYQDSFFEYMMLTSKGAKMPRGDKAAIMQLPVTVPPLEIKQKFSEKVRPFHSAKATNDHHSKMLAELRDTLLPKLLSGEIMVGGTEITLANESANLQQEHA